MKRCIILIVLFTNTLSAQLFQITDLPNNGMYNGQFVDTTNGFWWGSTQKGLLLRTSTKGVTWDTLSVASINFSPGDRVSAGYFFNKDTGVIAVVTNNFRGIYKTYDNGNNWTLKKQFFPELRCIKFRGNVGYAFSTIFGIVEIYKSIDFGETWTTISYNSSAGDIGFIPNAHINSNNDFIFATNKGNILKYNGTWQTQFTNTSIKFNDIYFANDNIGYAVGEPYYGCNYTPSFTPTCGYYYKTTNGGATWNALPQTTSSAFVVNGINKDTLYFGASNGIYKSVDGGITKLLTSLLVTPAYEIRNITLINKNPLFVFSSFINGGSKLHATIDFVALINSISKNYLKDSDNFIVYPNPTNNKISISSKNGIKEKMFIEIVDHSGKIVVTQDLKYEENNVIIDLSILLKGLYLLKVKTPTTYYSTKIIINN